MVINDFSTLIQLAATLNIAFVAVEYAKAYTHTLSEKVFKFQDFIKESFRKCYDLLVDRETLGHMQPVNIGGKSTVKQIEKTKREYEIVTKELDTEKERLSVEVKVMCESKSLSSMSLWFFLYCTTALFLSGLEKYCLYSTKIFWSSLLFFTVLFTIIGWTCGERDKQIKFADFTLLRHCVIYFAGSSLLSLLITVILLFMNTSFLLSDLVWNVILILSVIFPYANFMIYFVKTKRKAKSIKKKITLSASKIEGKCTKLKTSVNDLLSVGKINEQLLIDD